MKILFITTQFPYPLDNGGKIGALNGLDMLKNHEVYLLSFTEQPKYINKGWNYFSKYFPNIKIVETIIHDIHIQKKPLELAKSVLKSYLGYSPYMVVKFEDKRMYTAIDNLMKDNKFDILFIDYLNMQGYGEYIRQKYRNHYKIYILKDHNIEYEIFKQAARNVSLLKKLVLNPIWKKTQKYEIDSIKKSDIVFSVCDENADYFRKYNSKSYSMKPTFEIKKTVRDTYPEYKLLYIGNLSWKPNLEGLCWFVENVYSILKCDIKDLTLDIIGSGAFDNPFIGIEGIHWRGFVEDISDIYKEYTIFIVPLFEGSGIRIKILEAFNHDIPVVCTSMSCRTIEAVNKKHLLIADTEVEFVDAIKSILNDRDYRKYLACEAKKFLKEKYSIEARREEFKHIIRQNI